jgi:hypothetical protein
MRAMGREAIGRLNAAWGEDAATYRRRPDIALLAKDAEIF